MRNHSMPVAATEAGFTVPLAGGRSLPVRICPAPLAEATDTVLVDHPGRLDVLRRLHEYPAVWSLLDRDCLAHAQSRRAQVRQWLQEGAHFFGAYKIGLKLARQARASGIEVKGFLDNDPAKRGTCVEGVEVRHPSQVDLQGAVVVVSSGRHGNAIQAQLAPVPGIRLVNMSEFLYALDAPHAADRFGDFVEAPAREACRYISAFLRLDDERSRQVFDALVAMRTRLVIEPALQAKSAYDEEYFAPEFVPAGQAARFVDAGAAMGDTLQRLESRYGAVQQAWLFEPELPAYYEALRSFADRPEVWVFNLGLDQAPSRATYQPGLTYDVAGEMCSAVPADLCSYIQGIPLDAIMTAPVGLFKLDIEGMEARALRGARQVIARDRPVIAVCAYHRHDDYWRLIDEVLAIRPDYRIGMRLYADILEDITLYFY